MEGLTQFVSKSFENKTKVEVCDNTSETVWTAHAASRDRPSSSPSSHIDAETSIDCDVTVDDEPTDLSVSKIDVCSSRAVTPEESIEPDESGKNTILYFY
ncbi:hypothetical protein DPMN_134390 [Dreissena polymorpha]|uniref:Uncharacterized protein n=1 Tax=Dreissena polymorpha TaxID=45954 RepID=A0A9D4JAN5_DREPO|nr:hypothetical protein DPMN_134390 [Dreissena polymorpha]